MEDVKENNTNLLIADIKKYLKTGIPTEDLKTRMEKIGTPEERLQKILEEQQQDYKISKLNKLLDYSNLGERFTTRTFENFVVDDNNQKAYDTANRFITKFETAQEKGTGIIFTGAYGVGKTHLACSIANELIKKETSVIFGSLIKLFGLLKQTYNADSPESETTLINNYISCEVLIIDDLGKEKMSEWVMEKLYYIINERYEHLKPIIITTNFNEKELIQKLTVGRNKSSIEAIISRLKEICLTVEMFGTDYRYNAV